MDYDALFTALIAWARAALDASGIDGSAAAMIRGDENGPRPVPPYLAMTLLAADVPVGLTAEVFHGLAGRVITGTRTARLSVQGFGTASRPWLEAMGLLLDDPAVVAGLAAAGFDVTSPSGVTQVSTLVDTGVERRFVREFDIDYRLVSNAQAFSEATTWIIGLTFERYPGAPDALSETLTVT